MAAVAVTEYDGLYAAAQMPHLPVLAFDAFADVDRAFVTIVLLTTATASVATSSGYRATDPAVAICEPTASSDSKARSPSLKR